MRHGQLSTVILASALLAACSRAATAPALSTPVSASVAVSPLPGATGVSRSGSILVMFDRAVDSASCASRFQVMAGDSSGPMVAGRMSWYSTYRRLSFVPDSLMGAQMQYFVLMRDSIMTRDSVMGGSGMGGGMMGGGSPMMFNRPPSGATRTADGMRWSFTTGT